MAILGAGSIDGNAVDAVDFCGGALGEVVVDKGGGALKGNPALVIAASAGSDGGSGFGDLIPLFGVGGGLGFGDVNGEAPGELRSSLV